MRRAAELSSCGRYRYTLERIWSAPCAGAPGLVAFIGLNPSTADADKDDPTIRRCVRFAHEWGYRGLVMLNLFAFRSADPAKLSEVEDPVGPGNDGWLIEAGETCDLLVAAWGAHPMARERGQTVLDFFGDVHALGFTKSGAPRHPLYVAASTKPVSYAEASRGAGQPKETA